MRHLLVLKPPSAKISAMRTGKHRHVGRTVTDWRFFLQHVFLKATFVIPNEKELLQIKQIVGDLESFGHRGSATGQERLAAAYVREKLQPLGIKAELEDFCGHSSYGARILIHLLSRVGRAGPVFLVALDFGHTQSADVDFLWPRNVEPFFLDFRLSVRASIPKCCREDSGSKTDPPAYCVGRSSRYPAHRLDLGTGPNPGLHENVRACSRAIQGAFVSDHVGADVANCVGPAGWFLRD